MNGAATNNLQATTVPTNAATYTVEGYLVQRSGQNLQDILNMVLESESNFTLLISGSYLELKNIQHRSWILFSIKWFQH
jgi:hypothetical protein